MGGSGRMETGREPPEVKPQPCQDQPSPGQAESGASGGLARALAVNLHQVEDLCGLSLDVDVAVLALRLVLVSFASASRGHWPGFTFIAARLSLVPRRQS